MAALLSNVQGLLGNMGGSFQNILDRILPPEKRAELWAKLQSFAINNPKLAAFLLTQIAITGFPLALFITFTVAVAIFSIIAALLIGLVGALLFTVAMVGVSLLVVLPTLFMTTFAASFVFLWGLGGYYLLKHLNKGGSPAPEGKAIGDKINNLTGGHLSWLMDGTRKKHEDGVNGDAPKKTPAKLKNHSAGSETDTKSSKAGHGGSSDTDGENKKTTAKKNPASSYTPDVQKHVNTGKDTVTKNVNGVQKRVKQTSSPATNAVGTVKGTVGGVTGL